VTVRIEDDGNRVERNAFLSARDDGQAVILGTRSRTQVLGEPVTSTVLAGNHARIAGNDRPDRWIHGYTDTVFERNESHADSVETGVPAQLVPGEPPPVPSGSGTATIRCSFLPCTDGGLPDAHRSRRRRRRRCADRARLEFS
jgi:hypothetical protein